jgi:hypothetical protein
MYMAFIDHLRTAKVDDQTIQAILGPDAGAEPKEGTQEYADYMARILQKCDEMLNQDAFSTAMFDRACCKSGYRLNNTKQMAKEHGDKPLEEKLKILGELKYMGKPFLNEDGDIETVAVGGHGFTGMYCPCWRLKGLSPADGPMPLSYCACCGGHFMFYYQKALGIKLRLKKVVSSTLNSGGSEPCVFQYQIIGK